MVREILLIACVCGKRAYSETKDLLHWILTDKLEHDLRYHKFTQRQCLYCNVISFCLTKKIRKELHVMVVIELFFSWTLHEQLPSIRLLGLTELHVSTHVKTYIIDDKEVSSCVNLPFRPRTWFMAFSVINNSGDIIFSVILLYISI